MADSGCKWWQLGCQVSDLAADAAESELGQFVHTLADGAVTALGWMNTFWLGMPTPSVTSSSVTTIQGYLSWYTFAFAVAGIIIAAIRMGIAGDFKGGAPAVRMLVNLIVATGAMAAAFTALMQAGDAFAPWIVEKATGESMTLSGLLSVSMLMATGLGPGFFLGLLAFFGAFANVAFMIFRSAMIMVAFAFVPTIAAATASETGAGAFRKLTGWLIAFVLFKPVAGVIYAIGILMLKDPPTFDDSSFGTALYGTAIAVVVIIAAALALPALIKFIVPAAAAGTSSMFSGAAVGAAAVAAGAAVVALSATGGAAAPAVAGGGAATSGGVATGGATAASSGAGAGGGTGGGAASSGGASGGGAGGKGSGAGAGGGAGGGAASGASTGGQSPGGGSGSGESTTAGGAQQSTADAAAPGGGSQNGPAAGAGAGASAASGSSASSGVTTAAQMASNAALAAGGAGGGPVDDMSKEEK